MKWHFQHARKCYGHGSPGKASIRGRWCREEKEGKGRGWERQSQGEMVMQRREYGWGLSSDTLAVAGSVPDRRMDGYGSLRRSRAACSNTEKPVCPAQRWAHSELQPHRWAGLLWTGHSKPWSRSRSFPGTKEIYWWDLTVLFIFQKHNYVHQEYTSNTQLRSHTFYRWDTLYFELA